MNTELLHSDEAANPPIECGIGTYTYFLVQAMAQKPHELNVVSQFGATGKNVYQAYEGNEPGLAKKIFDMAVKITPDVVHIQHEFGLYGELDGISVLDLIYRFKSAGTPVIITFHTVNNDFPHRKRMIMDVICREAKAIIVHESGHVKTLVDSFDVPQSKIHLIPHGAREISPVPNAKEILGLENKKVILLGGYFRPTKGLGRIIDIFPSA